MTEVNMIDEVVNSIIEAEDEAKRRVQHAEEQAADIISQAEHEAEQIRHTGADEAKDHLRTELARADEEAKRIADELLSMRKKEADAETEQLRKNMDSAVKFILESL